MDLLKNGISDTITCLYNSVYIAAAGGIHLLYFHRYNMYIFGVFLEHFL